jgi:dephospho-CoA kinase
MLKVGLTGGLACGKSFVGQALTALGCHLIEADQLGHEVLLPEGEAYADVVRGSGKVSSTAMEPLTASAWPPKSLGNPAPGSA